MKEKHTIAILLENEAGALSRVAGLFSARAYNIESLSVAPTEDPSVSRMTVVTIGSKEIVEQITKQLNKLVDVIKLVDLYENDTLPLYKIISIRNIIIIFRRWRELIDIFLYFFIIKIQKKKLYNLWSKL